MGKIHTHVDTIRTGCYGEDGTPTTAEVCWILIEPSYTGFLVTKDFDSEDSYDEEENKSASIPTSYEMGFGAPPRAPPYDPAPTTVYGTYTQESITETELSSSHNGQDGGDDGPGPNQNGNGNGGGGGAPNNQGPDDGNPDTQGPKGGDGAGAGAGAGGGGNDPTNTQAFNELLAQDNETFFDPTTAGLPL